MEPVEGSDGTDGRWWIARQVAPERVISTVDPEARHAHKTCARHQDGYLAQVKVEPATGLITGCALTRVAGLPYSDAAVGVELLADEPDPIEVLGDSAYGTGGLLAAAVADGHTAVPDAGEGTALATGLSSWVGSWFGAVPGWTGLRCSPRGAGGGRAQVTRHAIDGTR